MTNGNVAITIWWRTILLNALFTGVWAVFGTGIGVFIVMIVLVIAGFIVTMPLVPLIKWLLKFQRSIPYSANARYTWFRSMLVLIVWLFYSGIQLIDAMRWPEDLFFYAAATGTSLAVLAAVAFTKKDILSLPPIDASPKNSYQTKTLSDV